MFDLLLGYGVLEAPEVPKLVAIGRELIFEVGLFGPVPFPVFGVAVGKGQVAALVVPIRRGAGPSTGRQSEALTRQDSK